MALASSSWRIREEHQTPELQLSLTSLGEVTMGHCFPRIPLFLSFKTSSRRLESVAVVVCVASSPPRPHSARFKPQFNTSFIKLWKSLVSRLETCKFLVAARFAYKAENVALMPG